MLRATRILEHHHGPSCDRVVLDFDARHRRRIRLKTEGGLDVLVDLPEVPSLRDGDGLQLEDGRVVKVGSAPEEVTDLMCRDPLQLVRLAWHLGNRHLPTQIEFDRLRIRRDHVISDMARKLGADPVDLEAPFQPEGGAYGHGRTHGHAHEH